MKRLLLRLNQVIALFLGLASMFLLIQWLVAPIYNISLLYTHHFIVNVELVHWMILHYINKFMDKEEGRIISQRFHLGRYVYLSLVLQAGVLLIYYAMDVCYLEADLYSFTQKISVVILSSFGIYYLGKWYLNRFGNYVLLWKDKKKSYQKGKEAFSLLIDRVDGSYIEGFVRGEIFQGERVSLLDQLVEKGGETVPVVLSEGKVEEIFVQDVQKKSAKEEKVRLKVHFNEKLSVNAYQLLSGYLAKDRTKSEYVNGLLKEVPSHVMDYHYIHQLFCSFEKADFYQLKYTGDFEQNTILYDKVFIPASNAYLKSIYTSPKEAFRNQDLVELEGLELKKVPFQEVLSQAKKEDMGIIINPFGTSRFVVDIQQFENQMKELNRVMEVIQEGETK
ncbi:hypothetical protein [Bulleidia sp. zg-1006]|uniref:hypothetical protein n=1 Tax=Bulleidia sp. zg-1006 TaxID=2806552 RepID=UPI00193A20EA|nr:hypothetical protein [Bulleidia sp. zg-1006]QRG86574.1 hypothetical protein JOS54_06970 [Bulleidia sp. zg-1006]